MPALVQACKVVGGTFGLFLLPLGRPLGRLTGGSPVSGSRSVVDGLGADTVDAVAVTPLPGELAVTSCPRKRREVRYLWAKLFVVFLDADDMEHTLLVFHLMLLVGLASVDSPAPLEECQHRSWL